MEEFGSPRKKFRIDLPNWREASERKIEKAYEQMTIEKYPEFQDLVPIHYALKQINIMLGDLRIEQNMFVGTLNTKITGKQRLFVEQRLEEYKSEIEQLEAESIGLFMELKNKTEIILTEESSAERLLAWRAESSRLLEEKRAALQPDMETVEKN